jgi:GT2 family glycosyltransferase
MRAQKMIEIGPQVDRTAPLPEVSVIIPLLDHRGLAIESVQSWVRGQTHPRDRYEVIVPTDGSDPALEARVKALLEPQDQMIHHATTNLFLLYNLGARKARGKLLFFTEPHCIAEPDCLEQMVSFLATHNYDGACCDSVYICPNAMARMAARHFDAGFRTFVAQDDWRKVLLRGFAIYRDSYAQEGGFEPELSYFAEWELAARLHSQGYRLGYASRARVRHRNETTFGETVIFTRGFVRGECAYRMTHPVEYCEQYFGYSEDWASRKFFHPSIARSAVRASWTSLWNEIVEGGEWSMVSAQAKAAMHLLPAVLLGPRWRLLRDKWVLWMAMARYWLWRFNDQKLYVAYRDVFEHMRRSSAPVPPEVLHVRLAEVSEEWLAGFHAVERWEGESFRWSWPVSILRLRLAMGSYDVQVKTRALRQEPVPLCLGVFFNRHRVAAPSLQWNNGALSFRIQPSMFDQGPEQRLIVTCNPVRPWKVGVPDRRELGLPIFSIAFRPIEEAV